jgi:hypothetical protein
MTDRSAATTPLNEAMKCGIFTNKDGQILIIHRKKMIDSVIWVEYEQEKNTLTFVFEGGTTQDLGLEINPSMKNNLAHGVEVTLALMVNQKVLSTQKVAVVIKDY